MTEPVDIIQQARGWIGTRFHHQGRLKRSETQPGGVDCLGLLVGVADELNLHGVDQQTGQRIRLASLDTPFYGHRPDPRVLMAGLARVLSPADAPCIGGVGLFRFDGAAQHVAIFSDYHAGGLGMIHAYAPARVVMEHALDAEWQARLVRAYRFM